MTPDALPAVDLRFGDCLAVLRGLPDASVHAVICDPPYGLADIRPAQVVAALTAWADGDREHVPNGRGFMGRDWDAFVPPPAVWDECLRVLTPGGHLAAFAGSRTYDLMGVSIRMAGFEIRDGLQWLYGSGMPKGQDVGKAIDKAGGDPLSFRRFARTYAAAVAASEHTHTDIDRHLGIKSSSCYWAREDHRGGLPPRHHWEQVRDLLALDASIEQLYDEAEREVIGIREARVGFDREQQGGGGWSAGQVVDTAPATPEAARWDGWNTSLKPAHEPIVLARKPLSGTVAATVIAHGTGALHVDACRTAHASAADLAISQAKNPGRTDVVEPGVYGAGRPQQSVNVEGRWPANVLLDEGAAAELDEQSAGTRASKPAKSGSAGKAGEIYNSPAGSAPVDRGDEPGGASRFYPTFRYQAKAPASERPKIDGKGWPTVKPQGVMRWLVRLLTPPGGVVLDPFGGTGSTGQAARDEGFASILVERDGFAYRLACARLGLPDPGEGFSAEPVDEPAPVVDIAPAPELEPVDPILAALEEAATAADLVAVWRAHKASWTETYTARAAELRARLEGVA